MLLICIQVFKRPFWDACFYLGERGERVGLLALQTPAFYIAYSLESTGKILVNFSTCMQ